MNNLRGVEGSNAEEQPDELVLADDAFLDDLARGLDPSEGADELASLLLSLKAEVDAPMPPAPVLSDAPTTTMLPIRDTAPADPPEVEEDFDQGYDEVDDDAELAEVVELGAHRKKRNFRQAFVHGLLGAAAATLAIAGTGITIYNAGPDSPLWGAHVALFNDHAAVVELASTLEKADDSRERGDVQGALQLLDEARNMAADLQSKRGTETVTSATTVTVTQTPSGNTPSVTEATQEPAQPPVAPPPVTVTTTVTVIPQPAPSPQPTSAPQPGNPDNPNPNPPEPVAPTPVEPNPPADQSGGN